MPNILITGANRGLGLELVRQYAADGWTVHACCRNPENAGSLLAMADHAGSLVHVHRLDVTHGIEREILAAQLQDHPLDILLNNAGVSGGWNQQGFGDTSPGRWEKVFMTNTIAPLLLMEAFLTPLTRSEHKLIANMSSKMGSMADNASGGSYLYRSSKAALNAVTVSAARDLAPQGITVVALHPGWVRTDMGGPSGELSVTTAVAALRRNLSALTQADSGRFIDIDGTDIPW